MRWTMTACTAAAILAAAVATPVEAQRARQSQPAAQQGAAEHPKSSYYRRKPEVRGFIQRRGGYSYSFYDSINTYGDSRTRYGGVNAYRDPFSDRQTRSGPFDHGFFFDSGVGPRGGDSPYPN